MTQLFAKVVLTLPTGEIREIALEKASLTVGRKPNNDVVLADPKVSRNHVCLECGETGWTLVDLGSLTGTRVNGARVQRVTLESGDLISLGDTTLRFVIAPAPGERTIPPSPKPPMQRSLTKISG